MIRAHHCFLSRVSNMNRFLSVFLGLLFCLATSEIQAGPITIHDHGGVASDSFQLISSPIQFLNQDDRMLLVGFFSTAKNFVDIQSTSLTYNGQQLTHVGGVVQNEFTDYWARTDIYYLLNPGPFTSYGVSGTVNAWGASGFNQDSAWGMWALGLNGVKQQAPNILLTKKQNPGAPSQTLGGTVTTSGNDSMLVGFTSLQAGFNSSVLSSSTGVTDLADFSISPLNYGAGYKHVPTAGSTPFTWTTNGFATGIGTTVIVEVEAIPEPATSSMLLLGLAAVFASFPRYRSKVCRK